MENKLKLISDGTASGTSVDLDGENLGIITDINYSINSQGAQLNLTSIMPKVEAEILQKNTTITVIFPK